MNDFAMKTKIYQAALKASYEELKNLPTSKAACKHFERSMLREVSYFIQY